MKIRFKSEDHKAMFARRHDCNQWIADKMGTDWWECEYDAHVYDDEASILILDEDVPLTGKYHAADDEDDDDTAWVLFGERQYFEIVE
ncbi:hypothetical protein 44RRORF002c [Aeromonas phage 44RR2.8t]|uniref:Uncharacterized protein n=2 Tax=Biquartavirus 44RR2 TaxID=115987 RepID=Q6U9V0_9CAUD|nr:hypothetical protein ST44RRORF002c [Aeromonas phage 44RR2.8t]AAQ81321.1 hypothetical protein 44RRORF002c [Aeromonas phage 44RR2.8t]APU00474.1 hypothetical protein [Aeromonas phage 44RR2.8t.2]